MDETGNSCIEKYYKTRFNCMQEDIFIIFMNEKNFIIFIIKYIIYIWKKQYLENLNLKKFMLKKYQKIQ